MGYCFSVAAFDPPYTPHQATCHSSKATPVYAAPLDAKTCALYSSDVSQRVKRVLAIPGCVQTRPYEERSASFSEGNREERKRRIEPTAGCVEIHAARACARDRWVFPDFSRLARGRWPLLSRSPSKPPCWYICSRCQRLTMIDDDAPGTAFILPFGWHSPSFASLCSLHGDTQL